MINQMDPNMILTSSTTTMKIQCVTVMTRTIWPIHIAIARPTTARSQQCVTVTQSFLKLPHAIAKSKKQNPTAFALNQQVLQEIQDVLYAQKKR